uniref:Uncharacterized protein n=1 Tax=Anguilla anguilla TaxID=7936 RepID=A0A0E9TLC3_ANGAN
MWLASPRAERNNKLNILNRPKCLYTVKHVIYWAVQV